jgi:ABC-2 type transport system permease protein
MSGATHVRYEILRSLRNPLMYGLSIGLPLVVYYAVTSGNRHAFVYAAGVSFPLYFMTGMAAYGAMFAAIGPGGRLARDRARGWTRQLRITPLRARTDYVAKVLAAYLVALPALVLVFLAGATLGVRLDAAQWFEMTGLLLIGLVPFVLMGLILGHVIATDALVQVMGWLVVFFALFGGAFGSLFNKGAMLTFVKLLPSYWLVHAGSSALHHGDWPAEGWIVLACWTAALIPLAVFVYRHDTGAA